MGNVKEYRKGDSIIVPPSQSIYEQSSTQKAPLGTRLAFSDGRVFRYALNGAVALAAGKFVKAASITNANWTDDVPTANVAAGARELTLTTAALPTGTGASAVDGWLQINDDAGEGIQYKIKSAKANATTATRTDLVLYDPIVTALTTATTATIIQNPYYGTLISTAITEWILGVPPISVTAAYYYWLQTWGIAPVWCDTTPSAGFAVELAVTGGRVGGVTVRSATDTTPPLGIQLVVGIDTEYKAVFLMIQP